MIDDTTTKRTLIPHFQAFQLLARRIAPSSFLGNNTEANLPTVVEEEISNYDILSINHRFHRIGVMPVDRESLKDMVQSILDNDGLYKTQFWAAKKNLLREEHIDLRLIVPITIPLYEALGLHFIGIKDGSIYVSGIQGDSIKSLEESDLPERITRRGEPLDQLKAIKENVQPVLNKLVFEGFDDGKVLRISKADQSTRQKEIEEIEVLLHFTGPQHESASKAPLPIPIKLIV